MKHLFLSIALLSVLFSRSQTFVYHPFPDSNASWNINMSQGMCFMGGFSSENYSIIISGDTIIDNQPCKILTVPFVDVYLTGGCTQSNFPGYKGAIRQDISERKVYFIPPYQSTEVLLYDFTMEIGDTVKGHLQLWESMYDTVSAIDSVLVGSNYHKRWLINPCYGIYLIEGVGSTFGLIEPSPGCATDMNYYSLTCFNQAGQAMYPDPSSTCELITSISDPDVNQEAIRVFPNPSSGTFTIDVGIHNVIAGIQICNLVGKPVFQKDIPNQRFETIPALPRGTYLLNIIDRNNRSTSRKLISCH